MRIQGEQEEIQSDPVIKLTLPQVHKKLEEYFGENLDIIEAKKNKCWQIRCLLKGKAGIRIVSVEYDEDIESLREEFRG